MQPAAIPARPGHTPWRTVLSLPAIAILAWIAIGRPATAETPAPAAAPASAGKASAADNVTSGGGSGQGAAGLDWKTIAAKAAGQEVYFNAWGGSPRINAYIDWAAQHLAADSGVTVRHVKLGATSEAVSRILSELTGGNTSSGSVDLIWINGENFAALQRRGMLYGPWTPALPNMRYVDPQTMPSVANDFGIPVAGMEAPWGLAQLVFLHDTKRMPDPPRSPYELLDWAVANPGRFTYPQPPNYMGTTFLRQLLYDLTSNRSALSKPVSAVDPDDITVTVWNYLDRLHPLLWRSGVAFPQNTGAARSLFEDGEIDITISFDPAEAANGIASGMLPKSTAVYTFRDGTIGNASFLAIPSNSPNKEGAMMLANFLLSPQAQAHKQDPAVWGNHTALSLPLLPDEDRARFEAFDKMPGMPAAGTLGPALAEPHPSWTQYLDEQWTRRYASGN